MIVPSFPKSVNEIHTVSEAARQVGYSAVYVRLLADSGKIKAYKSGKIWLVYVSSLRQFASEKRAS